MARKSIEERFWQKVDKNGPRKPHMKTRCWVFKKVKSGQYSQFKVDGRNKCSTHVRWYLRYGYWPKQLNHHCDVKTCVRLSHIYEGTQLQNVADRDQRGRTAKGERAGSTKLTRMHVWAIRALYRWGESQTSLARKFGVNRSNINHIVHRNTWKSLPLTEHMI